MVQAKLQCLSWNLRSEWVSPYLFFLLRHHMKWETWTIIMTNSQLDWRACKCWLQNQVLFYILISLLCDTTLVKSWVRCPYHEVSHVKNTYCKFVHLCSGEDWKVAMTKGTSPLHIVDPTGFEVQLKKSIVDDDAFLPRLVMTPHTVGGW